MSRDVIEASFNCALGASKGLYSNLCTRSSKKLKNSFIPGLVLIRVYGLNEGDSLQKDPLHELER